MNIQQANNSIEESDSPYLEIIKSLIIPKDESNQIDYETNSTCNISKRTTTTSDLFQLQDEIEKDMEMSKKEFVGDDSTPEFDSSKIKKKKKQSKELENSKEIFKQKTQLSKINNKKNLHGAKNIYKFIGEQTLKITKNSEKMDSFLKLRAPFMYYNQNYLEILRDNTFDHWIEEKKKNSNNNFYLSKKSFQLCWKRPTICDNTNLIDLHYFYILKKITKDFLMNNLEDFLDDYKKKSGYSDQYKQKVPKILNLMRKLGRSNNELFRLLDFKSETN